MLSRRNFLKGLGAVATSLVLPKGKQVETPKVEPEGGLEVPMSSELREQVKQYGIVNLLSIPAYAKVHDLDRLEPWRITRDPRLHWWHEDPTLSWSDWMSQATMDAAYQFTWVSRPMWYYLRPRTAGFSWPKHKVAWRKRGQVRIPDPPPVSLYPHKSILFYFRSDSDKKIWVSRDGGLTFEYVGMDWERIVLS